MKAIANNGQPTGLPDWSKVKEVFDTLCLLPREARRSQLRALIALDPIVGQEVANLLDVFEGSTGEVSEHSDLAPVAESTRNKVPDTIENYSMLRRLGAGGMGEVYLAKLTGAKGFEKYFAIKCLHPDLSDDPKSRERLEAEAKLLSRLIHPNIVQVMEFLHHEERYYLVTELIEGKTLNEIVERAKEKGRQIPIQESLFILSEVLHAMEYAHNWRDPESGLASQVIHRDLNPRNLMVTALGVPKILDFGVANTQFADRAVGLSTEVWGTPGYVAPELFQRLRPTPMADIFSVTLIFCDLLFGAVSSPDRRAVRMSQIANRTLPPELRDFLMRGMAMDPLFRFASAPEMLDRLQRVEKEVGTRGTRDSLKSLLLGLFPEGVMIGKTQTLGEVLKFPKAKEEPRRRLPVTELAPEKEQMPRAPSEPPTVPSPSPPKATETSNIPKLPDSPGIAIAREMAQLEEKVGRKRTIRLAVLLLLLGVAVAFRFRFRTTRAVIPIYDGGKNATFQFGVAEAYCPLEVKASPEQVFVTINGFGIPGPTPLKLLIPCDNNFELIFESPGYRSLTQTLSISEKQEMNVNLMVGQDYLNETVHQYLHKLKLRFID